LLVFAPVFGDTSTGTYPDAHRRMCLEDEPKSGAIYPAGAIYPEQSEGIISFLHPNTSDFSMTAVS
jgi:hypothetical protein